MTTNIRDNLSLLPSLLTKGAKAAGTHPDARPQDGIFAERLDRVMGAADLTTVPSPPKAWALAETLSLQMLHSTLSLGDSSTEKTPQLFDRQSPQFQSLVKAYTSNLPETGALPTARPEGPTQLQELAEAATISPGKSFPEAAQTQGPQWLEAIITRASNRYGVDAGLIKAVVKAESGFNPNAVSHAGAQGLMQLMPGTARSLGVNDSFDPEQNVMAGTRFLSDLLKRYNGNLDSALAAYNWGPGNVDRKPDQLPRETREYLARVKQIYSSYTA
jgi:soluble lytic murein transglycosylase-like protein